MESRRRGEFPWNGSEEPFYKAQFLTKDSAQD